MNCIRFALRLTLLVFAFALLIACTSRIEFRSDGPQAGLEFSDLRHDFEDGPNWLSTVQWVLSRPENEIIGECRPLDRGENPAFSSFFLADWVNGAHGVGNIDQLVGGFDNFARELNVQRVAFSAVVLKIGRLELAGLRDPFSDWHRSGPSTIFVDYSPDAGSQIELWVDGSPILSANVPNMKLRLEFGQPGDCEDDTVTATSDAFVFRPRRVLPVGLRTLADAFLRDLDSASLRFYFFIRYPIVPGPHSLDGPDYRFTNEPGRSLFYLQVMR